MFSLDIMSSIQDSLRVLMLEICNVVYRLISFCFSIFESLGTAEIITNDKVQAIFSRISLILGLFMVFRITFAFIEYIIDPDAMTDKKKGAGTIIKKVIIVIVLLGSTSSLFKLAFQAQDIIVNNDIVSKVIFGTKNTDKEKFGSELSYEVFSAFYRINDNEIVDETAIYNECKDIMDNWLEEDMRENNGSLDLAYTCLNERAKYDINGETKEKYIIDFDGGGFLALFIGIIILYVIVIFTIQVGVRVIQLAYLQIIAPIPIVMYLTPKGDDTLKKYGTQCMTTFVDFFLRTAIIYFAVMLIKELWGNGNLIGNVLNANLSATGWPALYVKVIMILAILVFAKKVPALLKEIFPSLGGAAAFDYGLSFKKQVVEPLKAAYNTPLGWIPKLGKKTAVGTIGAIDRKIHNLPKPRSAFQQKLDKLTPGRAEVIKNRGEQKDRRSLYEEGRQIYDRYGGEIKFESGEHKGKLKPGVFANEAFRKTWQEVADAKGLQKKYDAELSQAQARLSRGEITIESQEWKDAVGNAKAAAGRLEAAKKDHENNRKIYSNDARVEDAFSYYHDMQFGEVSNDNNNQQNNGQQNNGQQNNGQTSNIIVEEHTSSRPRQEENTGTSSQDEYSRLVEQYNGETDPNRKAEIRRQLDDFERRH